MEDENGMTTTEPAQWDVFVGFSKSEPIEARFALAIKDGLEQLGRFAYEYEDWLGSKTKRKLVVARQKSIALHYA